MAKPKPRARVESKPGRERLEPVVKAPAAAWDRRHWTVVAGLMAAVIAVYAQTVRHDFINLDDYRYVHENPGVAPGLTLAGIRWALYTIDFFYWQPLTWISHMIDVSLFGLNPGPHHAVNFVLHSVNASLLFTALWRLTGCLWRSAAAAALFALHPLRVESVAWIAERKDVLSGLFWMATLIAYGRFAALRTKAAWMWMFAAFVLAVMSKPTVVTLPFVLLLLDFWPLRRFEDGLVRLIWEKVPLFAVVGAVSIITWMGQHKIGATISLTALPFWFRLWNMVLSYVRYLGKFFWPAELGVLYPYGKIPGTLMLSCLALLATITVVAIWRARRQPYLLVGWLWFLGVTVPVSGIAQSGVQALADRFTYLPMIGLAVGVVWAAADLFERFAVSPRLRAAAAAAVIVALAAASFRQTMYWKDSYTLFYHTLAVTNDNDVLHINLGGLYQRRGDVDNALRHFKEAVRIEPGNIEVHFFIGNLYMMKGDLAAAEQHYATSLQLMPRHLNARKQLAEVYYRTGRIEEAKRHWTHVLELSPSDIESRMRLMQLGGSR